MQKITVTTGSEICWYILVNFMSAQYGNHISFRCFMISIAKRDLEAYKRFKGKNIGKPYYNPGRIFP